jgi:hypothetical protein
MKIIERFEASPKGPRTEDKITETPHYVGVFDGIGGVRSEWLEEGRTMGQWGSTLAGDALEALPAGATIADFAGLAAQELAGAKDRFRLGPADRLGCSAVILPKRKPYEVWTIGDCQFGYRDKGVWHECPQPKLYDDITLNYRRLVLTQEILSDGMPSTAEGRARLAKLGWDCMREALTKQMLLANHPDAAQELGFDVVSATPVPAHRLRRHTLPETTTEVALCTDGFPRAAESATAALAMLTRLRTADPFLLGMNEARFMGFKGGFVQMDGSLAEYYDDIAYVRVTLA